MAVATLYRRYRPQTFGELVGQDHVREVLKQAVLKDKLTHAYLFHGPRGTGKTTTARLLAKRVNCLTPKQAEPCGTCDSCVALTTGRHLDVIEIDAASNRGIDDIRALREATAFRPVLGEYKVYIIDEVHMLTGEAAAALLKTLEEPAKHVLFILATTELHKVLSTIASRCQVYRFRRANREEMQERLSSILKKEKRQIDGEALDFIIDRAEGCYRDAESLLGQMLTLQDSEVTLSELTEFLGLPPQEMLDRFLQALVRDESSPAIATVDEMFAAGVDPEQFLRECIRNARDEAVRSALGKPLTWAHGKADAAVRLPQIIRALLQALQDLAYVPQPMIAVHLAILTICTKKGEKPAIKETAAEKTPAFAKASAGKPGLSSSKSEGEVAGLSVEKIRSVWKQLIEETKRVNPVASTFLRAVEPVAVADDNVTIRAQYSLHRTFFEKQENRKLLAEALSGLVKQQITVSFVLDKSSTAKGPSLADQRRGQEKKFVQTVKEVFGAN